MQPVPVSAHVQEAMHGVSQVVPVHTTAVVRERRAASWWGRRCHSLPIVLCALPAVKCLLAQRGLLPCCGLAHSGSSTMTWHRRPVQPVQPEQLVAPPATARNRSAQPPF